MNIKTLTRSDVAEAIQRKVGLSKAESSELVETIVREISAALIAGENVKISGFGSFVVNYKTERTGRNPKTGVEVYIPARRVLAFRASQVLKDEIAKADF